MKKEAVEKKRIKKFHFFSKNPLTKREANDIIDEPHSRKTLESRRLPELGT